MTTAIAVSSAALAALYIQVVSLLLILTIYHIAFKAIEIAQPIQAFGMFLLSWFSGIAVGMVLLALKPWAPKFVEVFTTVYRRANMFFSGKMFVANALPGVMLPLFMWNPLFHIIDQCRGFVFINYTPRVTSIEYPVYVSMALLIIGLMGEFYTRQYASSSWYARR